MNLSQESQLPKVLRYHACDASTQTTTMMETMIRKGSHVFRNPQTLEQNKNNKVITCHILSHGYGIAHSYHVSQNTCTT